MIFGPAQMMKLTGAFGNISYTTGGNGSLWSRITAHGIPGSIAATLCAHMKKWGDIYINNSKAYGADTVFEAGTFYNINVYFPKGKYQKN